MKTVIEMAREAGIGQDPMSPALHWLANADELERFAAIVREDALANEREKQQEPVLCPCCGKGHLETEEYCNSCGSICLSPKNVRENNAAYKATIEAAAIRARGE